MNELDYLSAQLTSVAKNAALSVGDLLIQGFEQGAAAEEKSSAHDLVTAYDRQSEQRLADFIVKAHPDSQIVGEEGGARGSGSVRWYIDPIDGTTNFATGFPFFCVSIGAELEGQLVAGVIFDPIRNEMFAATTRTVLLNDRPVKARQFQEDADAVLLTDFPGPDHNRLPNEHDVLLRLIAGFQSIRRMGSMSLALAYVAVGRADTVFSLSINPWDVAAGCLLVEQAGGRYYGLDNPESDRPWLSHRFVAGGAGFVLADSILGKTLP